MSFVIVDKSNNLINYNKIYKIYRRYQIVN